MPKKTITRREVERLEKQLMALTRRVAAARKCLGPEEVGDYTFRQAGGRVLGWAELFGDKEDLLVIHNMGQACRYCTTWADGFNGLTDHLRDRTAFWLVNNDPPERFARFAAGRGWRFDIASCRGTSFSKDMGFEREAGKFLPGVSSFHRGRPGKDAAGKVAAGKDRPAKVQRIAWDNFGPGDHYCALWPLLDLLKDGENGWVPKYRYGKSK